MCNCSKCGWPVFTKYKKSFPCPRCETLIECDGISRPEANPDGEPTVVSTAWVRLVKMLRKPEDKGVGDTVQRIAAKFGGERFKAWSKKLGMPCGCTERQEEWNRIWPY